MDWAFPICCITFSYMRPPFTPFEGLSFRLSEKYPLFVLTKFTQNFPIYIWSIIFRPFCAGMLRAVLASVRTERRPLLFHFAGKSRTKVQKIKLAITLQNGWIFGPEYFSRVRRLIADRMNKVWGEKVQISKSYGLDGRTDGQNFLDHPVYRSS